MKSWTVRFLTFLVSLGLGVSFVWLFISQSAVVTNNPAEIGSVPPFQKERQAEFEDLPSFDDYFVFRKPHGRLIHAFEDGIYRESEVVAKNNERWLVLAQRQESFSLESATARVKRLRTVSWPGEARDAKLSFGEIGKPIFALNYVDGLRPGPITTLFFDDSVEEPSDSEISEGFRREFELNGNRFVLRTSTGITRAGEQVAVLVLQSNGAVQVVAQIPHAPAPDRDIIGNLVWVGDLDHDGKLDLYIDGFNEKGATSTELYLSSFADEGKLIDFAASFGTAGC